MNEAEKKLAELNDTTDFHYRRRVRQLIRLRYDIEDEIALERQKDTKPAEYAAYFEYCEACKAQAKAEFGR